MSKNNNRPMGPHGPVMQRLYDQEDAIRFGSGGNDILKAGEEGWWRVWGARAIDIRPGDLVMSGWKDEDDPDIKRHAEYEVVEMSSWGDLRDSCRVRFLTTAGQLRSVGMLQPMQLCRWTNGNKLADSI